MPKKKRDSMEPTIDLSDDPPKEFRVNIRSSLHDLVGKYGDFYEQAKGSKPDKHRVVDGALAAFFQNDAGFQSFLKSGSAKRALAPASANQPSGG